MEGLHDPSIFKCVFMIGGPGSGKSSASDLISLKTFGFITINSDVMFTHLMIKNNLDLKMPEEEEPQRDEIRDTAKKKTYNKLMSAVDGRLGIVIDGTGENYDKIERMKEELEKMGYEFFLIVVQADLQTALQRNALRPRSVPPKLVEKKWSGVQNNLEKFRELFPLNVEVDNNGSLEDLIPQTDSVHKQIGKWAKTKPDNSAAKKWMHQQQTARTAPSDAPLST